MNDRPESQNGKGDAQGKPEFSHRPIPLQPDNAKEQRNKADKNYEFSVGSRPHDAAINRINERPPQRMEGRRNEEGDDIRRKTVDVVGGIRGSPFAATHN